MTFNLVTPTNTAFPHPGLAPRAARPSSSHNS